MQRDLRSEITFGGLTEAQILEAESWHRPAVPVIAKQVSDSSVTCPFADGKYEDRGFDVSIEDFN